MNNYGKYDTYPAIFILAYSCLTFDVFTLTDYMHIPHDQGNAV